MSPRNKWFYEVNPDVNREQEKEAIPRLNQGKGSKTSICILLIVALLKSISY